MPAMQTDRTRRRGTHGSLTVISLVLLLAALLVTSLTAQAARSDLPTVTVGLPTVSLPTATITVAVSTPTVVLPTIAVPTPTEITPTIVVPSPTVALPTAVPTSLPGGQPTVSVPTVGGSGPDPGASVSPTVVTNGTQTAGGTSGGVTICGPVTAMVPPTSKSTGSVTIAGQTLQLSPGAIIDGAGLDVGSDVCMTASLNPSGQVARGQVHTDVGAALHICGPVQAVTSPTGAQSGSVTIGGQTLALAPGATLSGVQLASGSSFCLDAQSNPQGEITGGAVSASAPTALSLCGVTDDYTPPTQSDPGSLTVGGQTFALAPGTSFSGGSVLVGGNLCATFKTDPQGQITGGSIQVSAPTTIDVCGTMTGYAAPTSVNVGTLTIGGQTFAVAPGTVLQGATAEVGGQLCAALTTNPQGQVSGGTITVSAPTHVRLCGTVSAYAPPTSVSAGTIVIAGQTYVLPAGWVPSAAVVVGLPACLDGSDPGSGTPTPTAGGTPPAATPVPQGTQPATQDAPTPTTSRSPQPGSQSGAGTLVEYGLPGGASPWHLAWDAKHNLWMTEINRGRLAELLSGTRTLREFPLSGPRSRPHALTVDTQGDVWVTEATGNRVDEVIPHGRSARLVEWVLPHRGSDAEGLVRAPDGSVWITEGAGRLARLDPRTGRLDEYALGAQVEPHDIRLTKSGPVFVTERGNTTGWVTPGAKHGVRIDWIAMPSHAAGPTHVAVAATGVLVTERRTGALTWLDVVAKRAQLLSPAVYKLRPRITTTFAFQKALPMYRYHVHPTRFSVAVRHGQHWSEWRLPDARSRPYAVVVTQGSHRVWMTETRGNCVASLRPERDRVLEYPLPQKHSAPIGLQLRVAQHRTQVWIALYGLHRLGLLTVSSG